MFISWLLIIGYWLLVIGYYEGGGASVSVSPVI